MTEKSFSELINPTGNGIAGPQTIPGVYSYIYVKEIIPTIRGAKIRHGGFSELVVLDPGRRSSG